MVALDMKPIPPTMRKKRRYIAFRVLCKEKLTKRQVVNAVIEESIGFFGENLTSDFGLWIAEFDEKKQQGFLICNRNYKSEVVVALSLIKGVGEVRVSFQVFGVSGTIKALKRKFLKEDTDMQVQRRGH